MKNEKSRNFWHLNELVAQWFKLHWILCFSLQVTLPQHSSSLHSFFQHKSVERKLSTQIAESTKKNPIKFSFIAVIPMYLNKI